LSNSPCRSCAGWSRRCKSPVIPPRPGSWATHLNTRHPHRFPIPPHSVRRPARCSQACAVTHPTGSTSLSMQRPCSTETAMTRPTEIKPREGEQPGTLYDDYVVGSTIDPVHFTITPEIVREYAGLVDGDPEGYEINGRKASLPSVISVY